MSLVRQAVRSLLQRPVFVLTALLTIALGIGANTAVYAVVHAVLLEPLPFRQPERVVQIWETHPELHNLQVSVPDYLDWKRSLRTLDIAAYTFETMDKGTLLGHGEPMAVQATNASSELFPLLGIEPLVGRLYTAAEEKRRQPVVLISEQLWRKKFSGDTRVVGSQLRLGAASFTITGVIPQRNPFPVWADIWLPLSLIDTELYSRRKYHPLEVIGRLKSGVTFHRAELETEEIARRLSATYPATNGKIGAFTVPLTEAITGEVRPALIAVWIAVGLVLLIACANLAHLTMTRALHRRNEIALRLALGASRLGAFRIFFVETSILVAAGGICGIAAAYTALPAIENLAQGQVPRLDAVQVSLPVLLFAVAASVAVAFLFALPSYLQIFRSEISETISTVNTRSSVRQSWLSPLMMGSEAAVSVAVLVAAIMLVRSFFLTLETPPGFNIKGVLVVHSPLADQDWKKSYQLFRNSVAPALKSIPGVEEVAAVNAIPMSLGRTEHSRYATRFGVAGREFQPGQFPTAQLRWCTPDYFHVLGIPLLRGRLLTEADHDQQHYLVNETFARMFFAHSDPVGQKILLDVVSPHPEAVEIAGVVGDVREFGLASEAEPTMYSLDVSPEMEILVRSPRTDTTLRDAITRTLRRIEPQQAISPVKAMGDYVAASLARQRFVLALIATFAGLAICLCGIGVYGVFSYSVSRRMREFGIRAAVGARRADLAGHILRECVAIVVPGVIAGLAISAACSQAMRSLLYRVSPTDGISLLLAALGVLALCIGSVLVPALRGSRVDVAGMLREQ